MKYKLILLFFLVSCANYSSNTERKSGYAASGFAHIINETPKNLERDSFFISHNKLRKGTKIRITNPNNKMSLEVKIKEKIKYDEFFKVSISKSIVKKLDLSIEFPFVEVNEIKKNKSFIAKEAITDIEEKQIANKAPIDQIKINNISEKKTILKKKPKNYSILVAEFYTLDSAKFMKKKLSSILQDSNYKLIYISKKNENNYQLLMGPYNTIIKLKNDYIILSDSNFEDLDIKTNE
jgi:hypothetical protein